jgi:hypothetical protein
MSIFDAPHQTFFRTPVPLQRNHGNATPQTLGYSVAHLATNKTTGEMLWWGFAQTTAGLNQIRADFPGARFAATLGALFTNRADWTMNSFPAMDDGVKSFDDIFRAGHEALVKVSADRQQEDPVKVIAQRVLTERAVLTERNAKILRYKAGDKREQS